MIKTFTLTTLCLVCLSITTWAQKKEDLTYAQKAADIQAKVWGDKAPEFDVKTIPTAMEKESAVIIAQSTNVEQTTNGKLKFAFYIPATATRTNKVTTFRERVKINDKAALDVYSTLEYQKSLDQTQSFLYMRMLNKKDTYIGVKIIKPNGKEVIVNTGEEVMTKNDTKDKQGKLAIPGLEIGDILDYYVTKVALVEEADAQAGNSKYLFELVGEYPILNYQVNLQYNKKVNVYYVNANGAPEFVESTNDNGDKIYNLKMKNLAKYDDRLWSSPLRTYPYIEFGASFTNGYLNFLTGNKSRYDNAKSRLDNLVTQYEALLADKRYIITDYKGMVKKYFKTGKAYKDASLDSAMRVLYDEWKYNTFCYYDGRDLDVTNARNKEAVNSKLVAFEIARNLVQMDVQFDILLVASRNSSSLGNTFSMSDLAAMIRIDNGDKPIYLCFDNVFTHYNEIPDYLQGEEVVVLSPRKNNLDKFDQSSATLPVIPSKENCLSTKITASLLPENMQKLKIERTVSETGSMRDDQMSLLLMENIDGIYTSMLNGPELAKRMPNGTNGKKLAAEYQNAFEKAREDIPENFKNEVKYEYGQEPQNLSNYKITNAGLSNYSPVFTYTGTFNMDNFVKKAGNNYILEAGKLIGTYNKIEDKERDRKTDIYMPSARTLSYDITITIPQGYAVKGVDELNHQQKNEVAELSIVAKVQGDKLNIKVTRSYTHNFEKAAKWPKLLEIMDAAYTFNTQKVLFEKI